MARAPFEIGLQTQVLNKRNHGAVEVCGGDMAEPIFDRLPYSQAREMTATN
jgi:hypothetical protein